MVLPCRKPFYVVAFLFFYVSNFYPAPASQTENSYTPETTIIAFDIHNVIMTKNIWTMIKTIWHYPKKWELISHINFNLLRKVLILAYQQDWHTLQKCCSPDNPYLSELVTAMLKTRNPINQTISLIQQLKEHGYTLHILSNCSEAAFNTLKVSFPTIFNLFDNVYLARMQNGERIKKPNPNFFEAYLSACNPHNKKVIFIDDKHQNIESAEVYGLVGIPFKNPTQLKQELKTLKIIEA